jgi:hypothetical protein
LSQREIEKLSKDNQSIPLVNSFLTTVAISVVNPPANIFQGTSNQALRTMENMYAPLNIPTVLNPMPDNYDQKIRQFGADEDFSA